MKFYLLAVVFCLPLLLRAQTDTTYWNVGGNFGINFNQSTLTNWAAGGTSSVAGGSYFNMIFDYEKDRTSWENTLDLGYGLVKQEGEGQRKAEDKIIFTSGLSYQLSETNKKWSLTSILDFRTQFAEGYNEEDQDNYVSKFMAPGYMLASVGIRYKPKPYLRVKLGPATTKLTFVLDERLSDAGAFGVDPGDALRAEIGALLSVRFEKEIFTNGQFSSNLLLFTNYIENTDKIDVNWENNLVMKINEVLSANIYNQLIYDYDVKFEELNDAGEVIGLEEKVQFKNILGLGLTMKFGGSRGEE